jgi:hypothetical protein
VEFRAGNVADNPTQKTAVSELGELVGILARAITSLKQEVAALREAVKNNSEPEQ